MRLQCFILTEACSCTLELAYFAGKQLKIDWSVKMPLHWLYYGSCRLLVMGPCQNAIRNRNSVFYSSHRFSSWSLWFSYSMPYILIVATVERFSISVAFTKSICLFYLLNSTRGPTSRKTKNPIKRCTKLVKKRHYITHIHLVRCITSNFAFKYTFL